MMRFESVGRRWPGITAVTLPRRRWGWWLIITLTGLFVAWLFYHRFLAPAWLFALPVTLQEALNLGEAAAAFTLSFIWLGLWWRAYRGGPATRRPAAAVTREMLYEMDPTAFERFVAAIFQRRGYEVAHRGGSGDAGVDLELSDPVGRRAIVQCKRYRYNIGPKVVRELFGTMLHERAAHAFLVTSADISASARDWAEGKPMTLIDGAALVDIHTAQQAAPSNG